MKTINYILSGLMIFSGTLVWADNSALSNAARNAIRTQNAQIDGAKAVRDTAVPTTQNTQNTINQGADQGRRSQSAGQMLNMMASAALFASCFASCPKCRMELCAMGAMAAAQGAHQGQAANLSDMSFDASEFNPGNYGTGLTTSSVDGTGNAGFGDNPIIKDGMGKLTESGYKVSELGVSYPDGSFKPSSAFDSPSAMIAAGIDPSTAQAAGDVLAVINEELGNGANVAAMPVDAGSGGGYSAGAGGDGADFGDLEGFKLPKMVNPFENQDKKKILAGKSMMVDGEPIGVKGDNIFDMVHRAYQKKRTKQLFIETSKTPARLPASVVGGKGG